MANRSMSKYDWGITLALFGGTVGVAGWIFGAALNLAWAPPGSVGILDIGVVLLCALGVMLAGFVVWRFYLSGRRLNSFLVIETLLGASFLFGTLAVGWMHSRGVVALAVAGYEDEGQPGALLLHRLIPPRNEFAYAAPVIVLITMALIWWPPVRRRLFGAHTHIQRGTPEGQQPWHLPIEPSLLPGFVGNRTPPDQPHPGPSSDTNPGGK